MVCWDTATVWSVCAKDTGQATQCSSPVSGAGHSAGGYDLHGYCGIDSVQTQSTQRICQVQVRSNKYFRMTAITIGCYFQFCTVIQGLKSANKFIWGQTLVIPFRMLFV